MIPFTIKQVLYDCNIYRYEQRFFSELYIKLEFYKKSRDQRIHNQLCFLAGLVRDDTSIRIMQLTEDWNCHKTKDIVLCDREFNQRPYNAFYIIKKEDEEKLLGKNIQFKISKNGKIMDWFTVENNIFSNTFFHPPEYWDQSKIECRYNI